MPKIFNPRHGKWKFELDFTFQDKEEKPSKLGKLAAAEITALVQLPRSEANGLNMDIKCELMLYAKTFSRIRSVGGYDGVLADLYDLADRVCIWVRV